MLHILSYFCNFTINFLKMYTRHSVQCNHASFKTIIRDFSEITGTEQVSSVQVTVAPGVSLQLIKHWKNLRRAFQHNDRSHTGYLSVTDFKRVLKECNIPVSQEDLYHIVSEFDEDMDGKISYVEFLDGLLRV